MGASLEDERNSPMKYVTTDAYYSSSGSAKKSGSSGFCNLGNCILFIIRFSKEIRLIRLL